MLSPQRNFSPAATSSTRARSADEAISSGWQFSNARRVCARRQPVHHKSLLVRACFGGAHSEMASATRPARADAAVRGEYLSRATGNSRWRKSSFNKISAMVCLSKSLSKFRIIHPEVNDVEPTRITTCVDDAVQDAREESQACGTFVLE